jgi:hypothetical protein
MRHHALAEGVRFLAHPKGSLLDNEVFISKTGSNVTASRASVLLAPGCCILLLLTLKPVDMH